MEFPTRNIFHVLQDDYIYIYNYFIIYAYTLINISPYLPMIVGYNPTNSPCTYVYIYTHMYIYICIYIYVWVYV